VAIHLVDNVLPTDAETRPHAVATVDWDGEEDGDLAFRVGDILLLAARKNDNWLEGTNRSSVYFRAPSNTRIR
jgi:hypothetical protein